MANRYEIIIEANDKASRELKKINNVLERTESKSMKAARAMKNVGSAIGSKTLSVATGSVKSLTAAVAASTAAFVVFGAKSLNALDRLNKASSKLGVSTKFISEYGAVADRAGLSTEQFEIGLQRFLRRLGQAQLGTGELVKPLERLGISMKDANGNFRDGTEVFEEFIGKLANTGTETQQLANAMGAFDTEGVAFINVAKMSAEEIDNIRKKAREAGIVVGDELAAKAAKAKDALADLTDFGKGFGLQFFGSLAKPLEDFAKNLREKINKAVQDSGGMEAFARTMSSKFLEGLATFIETFSGVIDAFVNQLRTAINTLNKILVALPTELIGIDFRMEGGKNPLSELGHEIASIKGELQLLEEMYGPYTTGINPFTGIEAPLRKGGKRILELRKELEKLEKQRRSYEDGSLIFLKEYDTESRSVSNTTKSTVDLLREQSKQLKNLAKDAAADNSWDKLKTKIADTIGLDSPEAPVIKTYKELFTEIQNGLAKMSPAKEKIQETFVSPLDKAKQRVAETSQMMYDLQEAFNKARMGDNFDTVRGRDQYTQLFNDLIEQQKKNIAEVERLEALRLQGYALYGNTRLQALKDQNKKEADIQTRNTQAYALYGNTRLQALREQNQKEEEIQNRNIQAYSLYGNTRMQALKDQHEKEIAELDRQKAAYAQYGFLRSRGQQEELEKQKQAQARSIQAYKQYGFLRTRAAIEIQREEEETEAKNLQAYKQYGALRIQGAKEFREKEEAYLEKLKRAYIQYGYFRTQALQEELETQEQYQQRTFAAYMQYGRTRTMSDRDRKADEDEAARKSYLETATGRLIEQLKTEDRELKNLQKSLANVDSLSKSTGISVERLTESLKEQIDAILERSNAGVDIAKTLQDEQKQFNQINDLLRSENGVQDLADQYGISADTLARSLRESRRGFDDLYRESATMTDLITDQWDEMSKNMASSITKGIMEGKGAFNSLADFLKDFSKRVIEQIIEKMLIQPMIDQMTNWM